MVTVGTASGVRRGSNRATSPNADNANDGDTDPSRTPAHTNPNGEPGSGSAAASGANDPPARPTSATSTASLATCPAPPCRNDGAHSRTHACAFIPDPATTPRRTASTAT